MASEDGVVGGASVEFANRMHDLKANYGHDIEFQIAQSRLAQIADPTQTLPAKDEYISSAKGKIGVYTTGWAEDTNDSLHKPAETLEARTIKTIEEDYGQTQEAYSHLKFNENQDVRNLATNDEERDFIIEAARLLDYTFEGKSEDGKSAAETKLTPRFKIGGSIPQRISTKVNVGLKNLIDNYELILQNKGGIKRHVLREVVSMADHMASTWREGLPTEKAYTPQVAKKITNG